MMNFNIIGAGRLGKALALALVNSGQAKLKAVCNANFSKAKLAVERLGCGIAVPMLADLPAADLTFITAPDDKIHQLAKLLAEEKIIAPQSIVVHCSGVLSSTALNPLKVLGCQLVSVHPLRAFKLDNLDTAAFQGCDCVIEGEDEAQKVISSLFKQLGARLIPIKQEGKTVYHAAAVIASNYLVTLAGAAIDLLTEAGIDTNLAKEMTTNLMTSSLNNIKQAKNVAEALTGPLQRGDLHTLTKHLQALSQASIKDLYSSAALATLPLTTLSDELKMEVKSLLNN